eukprot:2832432-Amphidinium_carterae.1
MAWLPLPSHEAMRSVSMHDGGQGHLCRDWDQPHMRFTTLLFFLRLLGASSHRNLSQTSRPINKDHSPGQP